MTDSLNTVTSATVSPAFQAGYDAVNKTEENEKTEKNEESLFDKATDAMMPPAFKIGEAIAENEEARETFIDIAVSPILRGIVNEVKEAVSGFFGGKKEEE